MKKIFLLLLTVVLLLAPGCALAADGTSYVYDGYTYDFFGNDKSTPAPFLLGTVIDSGSLSGIPLDSVDDVCTTEDGRIIIVDSRQSRIHVLDETGKMLKTLKSIRDENNKIATLEDGSQLVLNGCSGAFYHEKNQELYVADTAGQRVIVLDGQNFTFKRLITRPENMTGSSEFKPYKIAVDNADRIYIVVQASYEGIIELNEDGSFSRYFGVNEPTVNLIDVMWKSIATDAQKEKMSKTYAPAFSNIALDGEGIIMAVSMDDASNKMVFRLNFEGKNVLREMGSTLVVGDIMTDNFSQFVDIAVKPYGTYAVIDRRLGHIFLYNFDGELLTVFGSNGNQKGQFKSLSAIAWLGDKLVVGDSTLKCAYILEPTDFGQALLNANEDYYYGRWDEATENFQEVLRLCGNLETAYVGIGKNLLMQEKYKDAMYYFKLGNSREFYSKAYKGYRSEVMRDHFWVIAIVAVALIGWVLWSEISYNRKQRRANK